MSSQKINTLDRARYKKCTCANCSVTKIMFVLVFFYINSSVKYK